MGTWVSALFLALALAVAASGCEATSMVAVDGPKTPTHSIFPVLTKVAATAQPTPLPFVVSPETGIMPGRSTEADVRARLGDPKDIYMVSGRKAWWYLESASKPGIQAVVFSGDVVYEVIINEAESSMTAQVATEYGFPEALLIVALPQMEEPPRPTPMAWLLYPARGFRLGFYCVESYRDVCRGVQRNSPIVQKIYHAPMTLGDWSIKNVTGPGYEIKPWAGFAN